MNHNAAAFFFDLMHGHPRETCPHCGKPKHAEKCKQQLAYERHALWELDDAERRQAIEDAMREDGEFVGASNGSVNWEEI